MGKWTATWLQELGKLLPGMKKMGDTQCEGSETSAPVTEEPQEKEKTKATGGEGHPLALPPL